MTKTTSPITRLALARISGMTCYGTGPDDAAAIYRAYREVKESMKNIGKFLPGAVVTMAVYDYTPWSHIRWDDMGVYGDAESGGTITRAEITPLSVVTLSAAKGEIVSNISYADYVAARKERAERMEGDA